MSEAAESHGRVGSGDGGPRAGSFIGSSAGIGMTPVAVGVGRCDEDGVDEIVAAGVTVDVAFVPLGARAAKALAQEFLASEPGSSLASGEDTAERRASA